MPEGKTLPSKMQPRFVPGQSGNTLQRKQSVDAQPTLMNVASLKPIFEVVRAVVSSLSRGRARKGGVLTDSFLTATVGNSACPLRGTTWSLLACKRTRDATDVCGDTGFSFDAGFSFWAGESVVAAAIGDDASGDEGGSGMAEDSFVVACVSSADMFAMSCEQTESEETSPHLGRHIFGNCGLSRRHRTNGGSIGTDVIRGLFIRCLQQRRTRRG